MSDDTVSIGELEKLREGWPDTITPVLDSDGEWEGKFDHSENEHDNEGYLECSSYGMDSADLFAKLIAAEHNATPGLIEIVKAALAYENAECDRADCDHPAHRGGCAIIKAGRAMRRPLQAPPMNRHAASAVKIYASYCHGNRDGWECTWPLTFRVRSEDGTVQDFEVSREVVPEFSAHPVKTKEPADGR